MKILLRLKMKKVGLNAIDNSNESRKQQYTHAVNHLEIVP